MYVYIWGMVVRVSEDSESRVNEVCVKVSSQKTAAAIATKKEQESAKTFGK